MSVIKLDVQWSPNVPEKFITFGADLSLYQVEEIKDGPQRPLTHRLSETRCAHLLFTNTNHQYLKCAAWCPRLELDYLLAVGQANGKVVLTSFENSQESSGFIGREFVPRHPRQCNSVMWNPVECNLLASGLDRIKTDHSILIWDILKNSKQGDSERRIFGLTSEPSVYQTKPIVELGHSETVHSMHWFAQQPKTLIAGMSNKHLKIYDIRDSTKHQSISPTKAVYCVTVDPFHEHRVASCSENLVVTWDTRNFEKPVLQINEPKNVVKLAWCPTRYNLLASVAKDSNVFKVYDVQHTSVNSEEVEPLAFERNLSPFGPNALSSFAWHPKYENYVLLVGQSGAIMDYTVFERMTLNWSPSSRLVWSYGKRHFHYIEDSSPFYDLLDDVSVKIKQRALLGYGLKTPNLSENGLLVPSDSKIANLWSWIDMVKTCHEEGSFKPVSKVFGFQGVKDILLGSRTHNGSVGLKSDLVNHSWQGLSSGHSVVTTRMYSSEERQKALLLCGWGVDRDGIVLSSLLESLENEGAFERASAIAVFNLKIRRAIDSLKRGALTNFDLNVVAMALSGFTDDKNALWREMSNTLRSQLRHPYLRAMFAFLTCDDDSYDVVLNENGVFIQDKVAFACMFLPDVKLSDFINKLTAKTIAEGNLDGILLTGLAHEGVDLLQQYVDVTGDVQTACMVSMHSLPSGISEDGRVHQWVESYRNILDQWRLWHQRAQFDVFWNKVDQASRPAHQVLISCNFCGKSISSYVCLQSQGIMRPRPGGYPNKTRMTSCPGCRKPLPRCSVCLTNMGTASGMVMGLVRGAEDKDELKRFKVNKHSSWFTWCQSCRHGGHSGHIIEWFKDHIECPVTSCTCKCTSLDSVSRIELTNTLSVKVS